MSAFFWNSIWREATSKWSVSGIETGALENYNIVIGRSVFEKLSETKKSFFKHAPAVWTENSDIENKGGENLCRFIREKSVFSGIAIGKIRVYKKNERQVKRVKVENPDCGDGTV